MAVAATLAAEHHHGIDVGNTADGRFNSNLRGVEEGKDLEQRFVELTEVDADEESGFEDNVAQSMELHRGRDKKLPRTQLDQYSEMSLRSDDENITPKSNLVVMSHSEHKKLAIDERADSLVSQPDNNNV